ncbi:MAG: hypothetical protein IT291_00925 [Deltaproteobacteria bacterium]|nr:hypothetical protein [Deltaproteobacteria bacterium]
MIKRFGKLFGLKLRLKEPSVVLKVVEDGPSLEVGRVELLESVNRQFKRLRCPSLLILLGFFLIVLLLSQMSVRADKKAQAVAKAKNELFSQDVFGKRYSLNADFRTRPNPDVPLAERLFCRGRKVAKSCVERTYHPYITWWKQWGEDKDMSLEKKERVLSKIQKTFGQDQS